MQRQTLINSLGMLSVFFFNIQRLCLLNAKYVFNKKIFIKLYEYTVKFSESVCLHILSAVINALIMLRAIWLDYQFVIVGDSQF